MAARDQKVKRSSGNPEVVNIYPCFALHPVLRKTWARPICVAILVSLLSAISSAQAISPVITVDHGPNAPQQLAKPYVILVSLDGFRYDYAERHHAKHGYILTTSGLPEDLFTFWSLAAIVQGK